MSDTVRASQALHDANQHLLEAVETLRATVANLKSVILMKEAMNRDLVAEIKRLKSLQPTA